MEDVRSATVYQIRIANTKRCDITRYEEFSNYPCSKWLQRNQGQKHTVYMWETIACIYDRGGTGIKCV